MTKVKRKFTGRTADEATERGLRELGVDLEDIEVRVISPGRSGILGLGGAPAEIEITTEIIQEDTVDDPPEQYEATVSTVSTPKIIPNIQKRRPKAKTAKTQNIKAPAKRTKKESRPTMPSEQPLTFEDLEDDIAPDIALAERDMEAERMVGELLDYLLDSMGVTTETYVRDELENGSSVFEIEGPDAGLLIGHRGGTLRALQFLVRLVVKEKLGRPAYFVIDVGGYRQRRFNKLQQMATAAASRVATTGRQEILDPMPPGERRIVHMILSSHPQVSTKSQGGGRNRRVLIRSEVGNVPDSSAKNKNRA